MSLSSSVTGATWLGWVKPRSGGRELLLRRGRLLLPDPIRV